MRRIDLWPLRWQHLRLWRFYGITWRHRNPLRLRWHNMRLRWRYLVALIRKYQQEILAVLAVIVILVLVGLLVVYFDALMQFLGLPNPFEQNP